MLAVLSVGPTRVLSMGGTSVLQHVSTGYVDVTSLCAAGGKRFEDWIQKDENQQLITKISERTGVAPDALVVEDAKHETTWADLGVAAVVACWVDPAFIDQIVYSSYQPFCHDQKFDAMERAVRIMYSANGLDDRDREYIRATTRNIMRRVLWEDEDDDLLPPYKRTRFDRAY